MNSLRSERYKAALREVNLREVARETSRGYSTLQAYLSGRRRVTDDAVRELVDFLRGQAQHLNQIADGLDLAEEAERNG